MNRTFNIVLIFTLLFVTKLDASAASSSSPASAAASASTPTSGNQQATQRLIHTIDEYTHAPLSACRCSQGCGEWDWRGVHTSCYCNMQTQDIVAKNFEKQLRSTIATNQSSIPQNPLSLSDTSKILLALAKKTEGPWRDLQPLLHSCKKFKLKADANYTEEQHEDAQSKRPLLFHLPTVGFAKLVTPQSLQLFFKQNPNSDLLSDILTKPKYEKALIPFYANHGMKPNARNNNGDTPIIHGIQSHPIDIDGFKYLFAAKATLEEMAVKRDCKKCPSPQCKGHTGYEVLKAETETAKKADNDIQEQLPPYHHGNPYLPNRYRYLTRYGSLCEIRRLAGDHLFEKAESACMDTQQTINASASSSSHTATQLATTSSRKRARVE